MATKHTKHAKLPANTVPDIQLTKPEVFVIESLDGEDQDAKRFEGQILCDMLRLCGKNPKYYYFQSRSEIPHIVGLFRESQYRYLHVSCHASDSSISTTNDTLSYDDFAGYFKGHLRNRRLFCSACNVGNTKFVNAIAAVNKGMYSIAAPACDIQFDHAAAAWAIFYVSMFTENESAMKRSQIRHRFESLAKLLPLKFYFATYQANKDDWQHETIGP